MFPRRELNYNNKERRFLCGPYRDVISGTSWKLQWSLLVGERVSLRLLWFSPCELLLLEAGSWGSEIVRVPKARGTFAVGNRYQTTASGDCNRLRRLSTCSLSFLFLPLWGRGHPWNALFHFNFLILRHSIGLLGREISPSQGCYICKQRINADKHPCLAWDSNPRSQRSSGRRQFMLRSRGVQAVMNCKVCELAKALELLLVTFCKNSTNPITNPNPDYNQSRDNK
jgi:hypothetical protein